MQSTPRYSLTSPSSSPRFFISTCLVSNRHWLAQCIHYCLPVTDNKCRLVDVSGPYLRRNTVKIEPLYFLEGVTICVHTSKVPMSTKFTSYPPTHLTIPSKSMLQNVPPNTNVSSNTNKSSNTNVSSNTNKYNTKNNS